MKPLREAAYRAAERWIVARQEADGSWGGIQPPWVYSLIALKLRGYSLDHPVMRKGLEGFDGAWSVEDDETFNPQACLSPVWDTALAMIALLDSGLAPDHPALVQAGRWLLREQVLTGGDWQVKAKGVAPGGWSFEFENDMYPDTDDTAAVLIALSRTEAARAQAESRRRSNAAFAGSMGMQSSNGGWGAFDKDNTRRIVNEIPFCDFGEVIDPPSEDVTAHVVEALSVLGRREIGGGAQRSRVPARGAAARGSWFGAVGCEPHLRYRRRPARVATRRARTCRRPYVRRAARWLAGRQNADGGWGETCESYVDPAQVGTWSEHRLADGVGADGAAGGGAATRPRVQSSAGCGIWSSRRKRMGSGRSRSSRARGFRGTSTSSTTCTGTTFR